MWKPWEKQYLRNLLVAAKEWRELGKLYPSNDVFEKSARIRLQLAEKWRIETNEMCRKRRATA